MELGVLIDSLADELARRVLPLFIAAIPAPREEPPLMLDAAEVGRELRLSESAVRALWKSEAIASVKVGGLRRTRRSDLLAYIEGLPAGYHAELALVDAVAA